MTFKVTLTIYFYIMNIYITYFFLNIYIFIYFIVIYYIYTNVYIAEKDKPRTAVQSIGPQTKYYCYSFHQIRFNFYFIFMSSVILLKDN